MLDFVYIVEPLSQSSASSQTRIFMEMKSDYPLWNFDAAVDAAAFYDFLKRQLTAQRWRCKINDKHSSIFIVIIICVIITLWLFQVIASLYDFKAATSIEAYFQSVPLADVLAEMQSLKEVLLSHSNCSGCPNYFSDKLLQKYNEVVHVQRSAMKSFCF